MGKTNGLSLTELLIALLLSSLIIILLMRHYLQLKEQGQYLDTQVDQSLEIQLAADLMRESVKKAGYSPCANIDALLTKDARQGDERLHAIILSDHQIQMNRMSEEIDVVLKILNPHTLVTTEYHGLHGHQFVIISDCYHAEAHEISQVSITKNGQLIRLKEGLAYVYHDPIYIGSWIKERYFIQNKGKARPSLFYQLNHPEELTTAIQYIEANIEKRQTEDLWRITLGLDQKKTLTLEILRRTS